MSTFNRARKIIEDGLSDAPRSGFIPFNKRYRRFRHYLPGIEMGTYYIISSSSGVGKSQILDDMFLFTAYDYCRENNLKLKVFYYSLEMPKEEKMLKWILWKLKQKYNLRKSMHDLMGYKKIKLTKDELYKIDECKAYMEELEDVVTILDSDINPYGIYKEVETYANTVGTTHYKTLPNGDKIYSHYTRNDDAPLILLIIDHLGLILTEKGMDLRLSMKKCSKDARILRNRYKVSPVVVQQQANDTEKQVYYSGKPIISKCEPSTGGLADCKDTHKDCNVFLGLFSPLKYRVPEQKTFMYRGYDMDLMGDYYRNLSMKKSRHGLADLNVGMFFDGATSYFKELPKPDDVPNMEAVMKVVEALTEKEQLKTIGNL